MSKSWNLRPVPKWLASLATVFVFGVVGPPAGALALTGILLLLVAIQVLPSETNALADRVASTMAMLPRAAAASYKEGMAQASVTGITVAVDATRASRLRLPTALTASAATWLGLLVFAPKRDGLESAVIFALHLLAALICAILCRPLWRNAA